VPHAAGSRLQNRGYRNHVRGNGDVQRRDLQLCADRHRVRYEQSVRRSGRVLRVQDGFELRRDLRGMFRGLAEV
jgi:hypothetical protein